MNNQELKERTKRFALRVAAIAVTSIRTARKRSASPHSAIRIPQ